MIGGSERDRLRARYRELTQTQDGWLRICATALVDETLELRRLLDPGGCYTAALQVGPPWPAGRHDLRPDLADETDDQPALSAARAILTVASALADPANADTGLALSIAHWRRARVVADGGWVAFPAELFTGCDWRLRSVLQRLDDLGAGPPAGFTALVALALAGKLPAAVGKVEMPVLFDRHHTGGHATLRVTALATGPSGLYPDPYLMSFLATDDAFAAALDTAWRLAPTRVHGRCVTWAIVDRGQPCHNVVHGSLGAAFSVGLDELGRRLRPLGSLRLKRLDHRCGVTGVVDVRQRLLPVDGYENKLDAARRGALRVVIPRPSRPDVAPIAERMHVQVRFAADVPTAIRLTRTRLNPLWLARGPATG